MKTHPSSIEPLESRIAPATIFVTSLADTGIGSLREAITTADMAKTPTKIRFSPDLSGTIMLLSQLPQITQSMSITGTAPGIGKTGITIDGATIISPGFYGIFDIIPTGLAGIKIAFSNLTITGGTGSQAGGAVAIDDAHGTVTIKDMVIDSNSVAGMAGPGKGGAIDLMAGALMITGSTLSGNMATGGTGGFASLGGAVYIAAQSKVSIIDSTISGNTATGGAGSAGVYGVKASSAGGAGEGGGIFNAGALKLTGVTVSNNSTVGGAGGTGAAGGNGMAGGDGAAGGAAEGGGVFSTGTLSLLHSTVSGNTATGGAGGSGGVGGVLPSSHASAGGKGGVGGASSGGGVFDMGTVVLGASKVTGNSATGGTGGTGGVGANGDNGGNPPYNGGIGGGAGVGGAATGGGIANQGNMTLSTSTVSGNTANGGAGGTGGKGGTGGYYYYAGSTNYPAYTHYGRGGEGGTGGTAGVSKGGGIFGSNGATNSIASSTISGNVATAGAGGPGGAGGAGGSFMGGVGGSTGTPGVAGSATDSYGGGLFADHSTVTLVQATVVENGANIGGGLRVTFGLRTEIYNSTIAQNTAGIGGGGISAVSSPIYAVSTVIGENTAPLDADIQGTIFAVHSLIENLGDAMVFSGGGTLTNEDPLLGLFGFHGGLTETLPAAAHSPLIGAGSNPLGLAFDQRGAMRVVHGHIDIGAVELG